MPQSIRARLGMVGATSCLHGSSTSTIARFDKCNRLEGSLSYIAACLMTRVGRIPTSRDDILNALIASRETQLQPAQPCGIDKIYIKLKESGLFSRFRPGSKARGLASPLPLIGYMITREGSSSRGASPPCLTLVF